MDLHHLFVPFLSVSTYTDRISFMLNTVNLRDTHPDDLNTHVIMTLSERVSWIVNSSAKLTKNANNYKKKQLADII